VASGTAMHNSGAQDLNEKSAASDEDDDDD
jgi:hypothetical protein